MDSILTESLRYTNHTAASMQDLDSGRRLRGWLDLDEGRSACAPGGEIVLAKDRDRRALAHEPAPAACGRMPRRGTRAQLAGCGAQARKPSAGGPRDRVGRPESSPAACAPPDTSSQPGCPSFVPKNVRPAWANERPACRWTSTCVSSSMRHRLKPARRRFGDRRTAQSPPTRSPSSSDDVGVHLRCRSAGAASELCCCTNTK